MFLIRIYIYNYTYVLHNKVVRTRTECNISSNRKSFRNISRTIQNYPIMQCKGKSSTIHTGSIWISKSTRLRLWRVVTSMHSFEVVNVPVYHVICYLPSHAAPHFSKTLFFQGMISCYLIWKRGAAVDILQEGTCQSANMPTLWYIPDFIIRSHLIETHFLILVCYSWVASFKRWFWGKHVWLLNMFNCWFQKWGGLDICKKMGAAPPKLICKSLGEPCPLSH